MVCKGNLHYIYEGSVLTSQSTQFLRLGMAIITVCAEK